MEIQDEGGFMEALRINTFERESKEAELDGEKVKLLDSSAKASASSVGNSKGLHSYLRLRGKTEFSGPRAKQF